MHNMKHNNTHIIRIPKGEESEQGIKNLSEEIITQNFPDLVKENVTQVQEAQRVPKKLDPVAYTKTHHKMSGLPWLVCLRD